MSDPIFPSRFWFTRANVAKPIWRGSDEWGRHTIVLQLPFVGGLVIATHPCTDAEMEQFACTWPGCPFMGMTTDSFCPTHDPEWLT